MIEVREVDEQQTRPLRQRVLRPHQRLEDLGPSFETDVDGRFGAFAGEALVGIISVQPEDRPGGRARAPWRMRGMAVAPEYQHSGIGGLLVERAIRHIRDHGGDEIWCHGRTPVLGFYEAMGFHTEGAEFDVPHTGPHFVMVCPLSPAD